MVRFARFHGPSEQVGHGAKDSYRFSRQHGGGGGGGGEAVVGAVILVTVGVYLSFPFPSWGCGSR